MKTTSGVYELGRLQVREFMMLMGIMGDLMSLRHQANSSVMLHHGLTCWDRAITCICLTTDCDSTQPAHCHTWKCRTFSNPAISNISRHLQTGRDSALTACTPFICQFSIVYLDSFNPFHVHMCISHLWPEELSPSLEINFDSESPCAYVPPFWPV